MRSRSNKSGKAAFLGVFTALTASLCCIVPFLALIAGSSGILSAFSWLEPLRPYLMGFTVLILGFAWYLQLKPANRKEEECCEEDKAQPFFKSRTFLFIVTVFAGLLLAFPYYSQSLFQDQNKAITQKAENEISEIHYGIKGMTCSGCEVHIESELNKLDGVIEAKASYQNANTIIKYDPTKLTTDHLEKAIWSTGYEIVNSDRKMEKDENITYYKVGLVCNAAPGIGCGSRSKPILKDLDRQDNIEEALLSRDGNYIKIIWQAGTAKQAKKNTAEKVFLDNNIDAEHQKEGPGGSNNWLNREDVDLLSKEEAGIIAGQLINVYKEKAPLTASQEAALRKDIEQEFYDFFLNYESLSQLSDTGAYRKLILKITEQSKDYIRESNIPEPELLLSSCYGHSENCNSENTCSSKTNCCSSSKTNQDLWKSF